MGFNLANWITDWARDFGDGMISATPFTNYVISKLEKNGKVMTESQLQDMERSIARQIEDYNNGIGRAYEKLQTFKMNPTGAKYYRTVAFNSAQANREVKNKAAMDNLKSNINAQTKRFEAASEKREAAKTGPLNYVHYLHTHPQG